MLAKLKEEYIDKYCGEKKYTVKKTPKSGHIRIDVSNLKEQINISLYETGSVVIGGSPKFQLKAEFDDLKRQMEDSPEILEGQEKLKVRSCASKYNILLVETRNRIRDSLRNITQQLEFILDPTPSEEYRAKLTLDNRSLSLTQYANGTLYLQGKEDLLFDSTCDLIEKIAVPNDQEVIARFISGNDDALASFTSSYTPRLLEDAEKQIRTILGDEVFNFLDAHDQKWFVAAECLRIINIPLPEFSPIIMPASKAFEGYIKKLLVKVGFYPANHFDAKSSSFAYLNDPTNPTRIAFVAKEKYTDTYLKKINVCLDTNRNFMMHSDGSLVTKIEKYADAEKKLDEIYDDIKEIYDYFKKNAVFGL